MDLSGKFIKKTLGDDSDYPYLNTELGVIGKITNPIKRYIAAFNPFAQQQIPSVERAGFYLRNGNNYYYPDPYPEKTSFTRWFPVHYNPAETKETGETNTMTGRISGPGVYGDLAVGQHTLPKGCDREMKKVKRCKMINGESNCEKEELDALEICPNFALLMIRNDNRLNKKIDLIHLNDYKKAMQISDYNKGRSLKDVDVNKTREYGHRKNLRPNTLWADDRYANVTEEEVEAAQKRVKERTKLLDFGEVKKPVKPDFKYQSIHRPTSVYYED